MGDSYYNITTGYEVMAPGVEHGERAEEAQLHISLLSVTAHRLTISLCFFHHQLTSIHLCCDT